MHSFAVYEISQQNIAIRKAFKGSLSKFDKTIFKY